MFNTTKKAYVSNEIGTRGFGFVKDGEIDIFIGLDTLLDSGFLSVDFKFQLSISLEYEVDKQGRFRAVRVRGIGSKLSPKIFIEKTVQESREKKLIITKVEERLQYGNPVVLGYRVYSVPADGRRVLLGYYGTLAFARDMHNLRIVHPVPIGYKTPTNVPQPNKGTTGGGQSIHSPLKSEEKRRKGEKVA